MREKSIRRSCQLRLRGYRSSKYNFDLTLEINLIQCTSNERSLSNQIPKYLKDGVFSICPPVTDSDAWHNSRGAQNSMYNVLVAFKRINLEVK